MLSSRLKVEIITLIALQDMVNLRLSSRTWTIACTPFVFRDGLTIRPYGNGMQNFNEICSQPRFANQIKHLSISVHELDHEPLKPWMIEAHNLPLEEIDPGDQTSLLLRLKTSFDCSCSPMWFCLWGTICTRRSYLEFSILLWTIGS